MRGGGGGEPFGLESCWIMYSVFLTVALYVKTESVFFFPYSSDHCHVFTSLRM